MRRIHEFVYYLAHHMPAKSQRQANLMRAAANGAAFPAAQKIRTSMNPRQIQDFERVALPKPMARHPHQNLGAFLHPKKTR